MTRAEIRTEAGLSERTLDELADALLVYVAAGSRAIHKRGRLDEDGTLTTGKLAGHWPADELVALAREHGRPVIDSRTVSDSVRAGYCLDRPILAHHPREVDRTGAERYRLVSPREMVEWCDRHGATVYNAERADYWP